MQEVFINLDDSGKLSLKENFCVYGGLVFLSKKEKDKFITQYRQIINKIKCSYCPKMIGDCDKKCPLSDKRWAMNYLKKYFIVALIIKNNYVYDYIIDSKSAKGRFIDYSLRRLIKEIIKNLIIYKKIDPTKSVRIIINIDQQSTKSNGYYNLSDWILEELKYGITNYNYAKKIVPILKGKVEISITYQDSNKSYVVQAADLLAGTVRRQVINNYSQNLKIDENLEKLVDFKIILP